MNYLSLGIVHITFSAVELSISAFFAGISVLLSSFEDISSRLFERASDFSGVPPRASFPTEKCAILILGAQEGASFTPPIKLNFDACTPESGVGQNAALRFSELGYTVFALCPNRHEHSLSSGGKSTDVASVRSIIQLFLASAYLPQKKKPPDYSKLLYTWHNRKERSRSIPWGLIAPMQLNLWSRPQREAVRETVRAHCSAYDLHLVALVISHDSKSLRDASPSFVDVLDATDRADVPSESHGEEDAWRNSVLGEVTEPVLMARDYKNLLAEASGRVIILSDFADGRYLWFHPINQCFTLKQVLL